MHIYLKNKYEAKYKNIFMRLSFSKSVEDGNDNFSIETILKQYGLGVSAI